MARYRPPFIFTDEQFIDAVKKGLTAIEIAKMFGVNRSSVYKRIRRRNISLLKKAPIFNESLFDVIDTEEKAYWLGFLYADGSITNKTKRHCIEISLKDSDVEHLWKFNDFLGYDRSLKRVKLGIAKCGDVICRRCRITIYNKHMCDSLIKLGCIPNKSLVLTFPDISFFQTESLVYDFLRGYIDGDGSIQIQSKKRTLYLSLLGTKEFINGMLSFINSPELSYNISQKYEDKNTYTISWKTKESRRLLDIMYANATIYLNRKYEKYRFAVSYSNIGDNYRAKTVKAESANTVLTKMIS